MGEKEFVDFASVRDLLLETRDRRGEISYEQTMALQHAREGKFWWTSLRTDKTDSEVFQNLLSSLMENEKVQQHPEICSKIAELAPISIADVRVIISSKRIAMDTSEIEEIITTIRQHVL